MRLKSLLVLVLNTMSGVGVIFGDGLKKKDHK